MPRTLFAATAMFILAACADSAPSSGDAVDVEAPSPEEPVSIIRPDIEEAVMIPLDDLDVTISFADSGSVLTEEAGTQLQELLASRQVAEGGVITLRGHSDAGGNDAVNLRVSGERAEAVRAWLVENGIAEDRITVIAFGEQNPLKPNALADGTPNEAGRAANRRVDIQVKAPEGAMKESRPAATAPTLGPTTDPSQDTQSETPAG